MVTFQSLLPTLEPWVRSLNHVWPASIVKANFPHFQVVHIVSLFVLGGCVILLNLRLIGVGFDERPSEIERRLRPVLNASVAGVLISGLLIGLAVPVKLYQDPAFLVKMSALLAGLVATYAVTLPVARAEGAVRPGPRAGLAAALALWGWAVWLFATTLGTAPGVILVIFAGALVLVAALPGRVRWIYLAGLAVILAAQQVVTHGFVGPDDLDVLDPVNKGFTGAEALWVLGFAAWLVMAGGRGAPGPRGGRLAGYATILIWVTVAAAGRWIAFD